MPIPIALVVKNTHTVRDLVMIISIPIPVHWALKSMLCKNGLHHHPILANVACYAGLVYIDLVLLKLSGSLFLFTAAWEGLGICSMPCLKGPSYIYVVFFVFSRSLRGLINQNMTIFTISSKLLVHLQPNLIWWYSIISQSVLWENGLVRSKSRSQERLKMLVNVCPDNIFWTTECFVTKPGIVMQHHNLKCHAEKLVHCVPCQCHSKGFYNWNISISVVFLNSWSVCNQIWFDSTAS